MRRLWRGGGFWLASAALLLQLAVNVRATELLNLNTASKDSLVALGLTDSQALQIISHREKNGPLLQVAELMAVPQMTKQTFAKIRERVTVDE